MHRIVVEYVRIERIKANPKNVMVHPPDQIVELRTGIRLYGFNDPLAWDEHDELIEGHGRLEAAELEGYEELPIFRLIHLSDAEKRAYMLAHNQIPRMAKFDEKRLANELSELLQLNISIDTLGFDDTYLDNLLREGKSLLPEDDDGEDDDGPHTDVTAHTRSLRTTTRKKFSIVVDLEDEETVQKVADILNKKGYDHRIIER